MSNWYNFWQSYRLIDVKNDKDLFYQAGKTISGKVINPSKFKAIVKNISTHLKLKKNDNLLDLCCGNGALTYELAKKVNSVIAIDFSKPFIENARKFKHRQNITYIHQDIKKLDKLNFNNNFSKVLLYDALAYFNKFELDRLLLKLRRIIVGEAGIMFGSVLDYKKKWEFYNTYGRKLNYFANSILGSNQGIGKWWNKKDIIKICSTNRLSYKFYKQDSLLHTAHYRFDVLIFQDDLKNV